MVITVSAIQMSHESYASARLQRVTVKYSSQCSSLRELKTVLMLFVYVASLLNISPKKQLFNHSLATVSRQDVSTRRVFVLSKRFGDF